MPQFRYEFHRCNAEASQAPGIRCSVYSVEGEMPFHSINAVKDFCIRLMSIPGVYSLRIRNTEPGCEWKSFGPIDTRNPAAAAEAVVKAKKKSKRTKQLKH